MFDWVQTADLLHVLFRAAPAAAVLALIWSAECIATSAKRPKYAHGFRNLSLALLNGILLYFTLGLLSLATAAWVTEEGHGLFNCGLVPELLHAALAFLALDLFGYLWHRVNHAAPVLWRFHCVHHSDSAMDVTTSGRFHVGELTMAAVARLPVILALGISPGELLAYETVLVIVSMFHHSSLRLGTIDSAVRVLVVTPGMHAVHHARRREEAEANFASVLSLWDRLFGTYRTLPASSAQGLDGFDGDVHQSVIGLLATPFRYGNGAAACDASSMGERPAGQLKAASGASPGGGRV